MSDQVTDDPRAVRPLGADTAGRALRLLRAVVQLGVADAAGVSERRGVSTLTTLVATDGIAAAADRTQAEVVDGPSIDAGYLGDVLSCDDVVGDGRWPRWALVAPSAGVGALIGVRLYTTGAVTGLLSLYHHRARAVTDDDRVLAARAGIHLTSLLHDRHGGLDPSTAAATRHLVSRAEGVLVERSGIEPDEAFALLHRMAREAGTDVQEMARRLLAR